MSGSPLLTTGMSPPPRSGDATQVHTPDTHADASVQPAFSHGVASGTGSPLQLPLPSQVAFCTHESDDAHDVPAASSVSSQLPVAELHDVA
jgi:hypothetical protein